MESENKTWKISELNKFAQKFQMVPVLCNISWFHRGRPPLKHKHATALKELAGMLGEPADARCMEQRVYDFIGNMLHLMRDMARERLPWESLPPALSRLGTRLDLIDVASVMETGECRADGAVNPIKVMSFATGLVKAVQRAVAERAVPRPELLPSREWETARFLKSVDAVRAFAREMDAEVGAVLQIWLRMYGETRRELCRAGREPSLSLAEWRLADLLLLHEPALPLLEHNGKSVCPERSLCFLVRLVGAGVSRLARLEGDDPVFGAGPPPPTCPGGALKYGDWVRSVWTAVHIAYCKKERAVSSVLLQRRWHELRRVAHEALGRPGGTTAGPLRLLQRLLPGAARATPPSWPSLVERGLVVDLTTLGCQNPDLLCLLDDIEHQHTYESKSDCEAFQEDTVRQLQAIDPSRAEVSIIFDPHSDSESEDVPAPAAAAPADKDDSLSFIIRQALNCRSIVRLQAPRLRELTDDILKKNCVLADKQTAADSSDEESPLVIDENKPELESETRKRPRSDSADSAREEPADDIEARMDHVVGKKVKREKSEESALSQKLALEARVMLERMDETPELDPLGLSPDELSRRYGVSEQGAAWWARNMPLAEKCRPLRVTLSRLRLRPAPRVALPDIHEIREFNKTILTAEVAPTRVRSPDAVPVDILTVDDEQPESRRFEYLYKDMLRMMARNAKRYLTAIQKSPPRDSKAAPDRSPKADAEVPQLSDLEKWEREKRVGLQYFSLPHLRDPEPRPSPRSLRRSASEGADNSPKSGPPSALGLLPDESQGCIVLESDSDSREEPSSPLTDERSAGILDDELSDLRRTEEPDGVPRGPVGSKGGLEVHTPVEAKTAGGKNVDPVITFGAHSIRLIEDTRHTAAERKRLIKQRNREKQQGRQGVGAETRSVADSSCYFKLPVKRCVTAAECAAKGGGKTFLMRADLNKPFWMVSREFVVLTSTPLTFARPSYWSAMQATTRLALTRVLFPDQADRRDPAVIDLTDETETAEADLLYKTLVHDPPERVIVYNMVQDIATFRRLNASRGSLFLFSLRTGILGHLLLGENASLPVISSVYRMPSIQTLPSATSAGPSSSAAAPSGLREVSVSVPAYECSPVPSAGTPPVLLALQRTGIVLTPTNINALFGGNAHRPEGEVATGVAPRVLQSFAPEAPEPRKRVSP